MGKLSGGKLSGGKLSRRQAARRLGGVKLLSLDVDGVLTDGGLYYADDGRQLRKFNVHDGVGIRCVMALGVEVAIISASKNQCILKRAKDLGIKHVRIGAIDKLEALTGFCKKLGISLGETAHMGDDINDLPVLAKVGLPLTVAGAVDGVMKLASYVTKKSGGCGAVREICDLIIKAKT